MSYDRELKLFRDKKVELEAQIAQAERDRSTARDVADQTLFKLRSQLEGCKTSIRQFEAAAKDGKKF